ncbi:MAG: Membrane protein insertase YidC [Alphaproteobacteria bacterium MarineAlpha9_Bin1]|nr:MAG: Membrane protein insertase YidC [Alphaproteobacteria bacterium MarineAlpha9_Bin1]
MGDQKTLLLAIVASLAILLSFQFLFPSEEKKISKEKTEYQDSVTPIPEQKKQIPIPRKEIINKTSRLNINNQFVAGSLALTGARIDDIILKKYYENLEKDSENIKLFSPKGSNNPYFAEHGWVSNSKEKLKLPNSKSIWISNENTMTPENSITLTWDNQEGIIFKRTISIDNEYMFTIKQTVINNTPNDLILYPYGLISRSGMPETSGLYILHEGPIGVFNDRLTEIDYDDLEEDNKISEKTDNGWLGITDKYWLAALIPEKETGFEGYFQSFLDGNTVNYQASYLGPSIVISGNAENQYTSKMYVGAKEVVILDKHENSGIPMFDRAVDFGWFYAITKPLFYLLNFFSKTFGNVGLAIIALTICIRIVLFPLANKSFKSMSKMKVLQPKMMEIRERYSDDKVRMQKEVMELYKREKANPLAGCLPILLQIPVFFALYKVLSVTIEMRHAPFYGWIKDLSAPDPYSIFNLFGLIPIDLPSFLMIGIWPLLMGATMILQFKLNPTPPDPMQAKIMSMLPYIFIFLFARFAAGLVIYWTCNNILSIAQQWIIIKKTASSNN